MINIKFITDRDRVIRENVDVFLRSIGLEKYSADTFRSVYTILSHIISSHSIYSQMHSTVCIDMNCSSRALCMAIWTLYQNNRESDAKNMTVVINIVLGIMADYPKLEEDFEHIHQWTQAANKFNNFSNNNKNTIIEELIHDSSDFPLMPEYNTDDTIIDHIPPKTEEISIKRNTSTASYDSITDESKFPEYTPVRMRSTTALWNNTYTLPTTDIPNIKCFSDSKIDVHTNTNTNNSIPNRCDSVPVIYHPSIPQLFNEKPMHIAILQTNPIKNEMGGALALNAERRKLERIFFRQRLALKVFFGVLTSQCLIRCISRGVRVVHISGHGPPEKKLKVEDNHGRLQDIQAQRIKQAILMSDNKLKLVFVSTCYSEHVAQAFCDAGVEHVVAVHSKVQILDEMATRFASAFYEHLIARHCTVGKAYNDSQMELILRDEIDCCCRHEGHTEECICPMCSISRCCTTHHSLQYCKQHISISCCAPDVPHQHSDKFLLLPKESTHDEVIFPINDPCVEYGPSETLISVGPTNVSPLAPHTKIVGRAAHLSTFVELIHPDNHTQIVLMYGPPRSGLSSLGKQIGRFFNRPWYTPLFAGGVWYVQLKSCDDPNALFSYISAAMKLGNAHRGTYSYQIKNTELNTNVTYVYNGGSGRSGYSYHPYSDNVQSNIHEALAECDEEPISFIDEQTGIRHYIILDQHKNKKDILQNVLPDEIFHEIMNRTHNLPLEVYLEENSEWNESVGSGDCLGSKVKSDVSVLLLESLSTPPPICKYNVRTRKIKFIPPNEETVLAQIKAFESGFEKLFIIDHIDFIERRKIRNLLKKVEKLANEMNNSKVLLICRDKIFETIQKVNQARVKNSNNTFIAHEVRVSCIDAYEATKLLLDRSRRLYPFDFTGLVKPSTAMDISRWDIFNWLARSPALINSMAVVLEKKVPLHVILACTNASPNQWFSKLETWTDTFKIKPIDMRDAKNSLHNFLVQINIVKQIWADEQL